MERKMLVDVALVVIGLGLLFLAGCRYAGGVRDTSPNDALPSVGAVIQGLNDELIAMNQARIDDGRDGVLMVEEATVELSFVAKEAENSEAGVKFEIISAGGSQSVATETVQKITVKLTPLTIIVERDPSPPPSD